MTKDDIIPSRTDVLSMAREAGFSSAVGKHIALDADLERFFHAAYAAGAAAEREACAKLLESRRSGANELMDATREMEAYAIRARGKT